MKKGMKFVLAVLIFVFYYAIFCWIMGFDFGDPWGRLMKWVKNNEK